MMVLNQVKSSRRRGNAIVMVLLVLGALMALSGALLLVTRASKREVSSQLDDSKAFYLAEAGLSEAVASIEAGATGAIGSMGSPAALEDGLFWVDSTPLANGQQRLLVTAMAGSGRAAIDVVIEVGGEPLFKYTLNSDPLYFEYHIVSDNTGLTNDCGNGSSDTGIYTFNANGDLDGDGTFSTFSLAAGSNPDNALYRAPGIFTSDPLE